MLVVFTTTKLVTIGFSDQSSNQITEVNSPIGQVKRINVVPIIFKSSQRQTALLELYTSEACGSCPPAELWLSRLKNVNGLWSEFVPVAFHVDYWSNLGWRDKFSKREFTLRQQNYAQIWSAQDITLLNLC